MLGSRKLQIKADSSSQGNGRADEAGKSVVTGVGTGIFQNGTGRYFGVNLGTILMAVGAGGVHASCCGVNLGIPVFGVGGFSARVVGGSNAFERHDRVGGASRRRESEARVGGAGRRRESEARGRGASRRHEAEARVGGVAGIAGRTELQKCRALCPSGQDGFLGKMDSWARWIPGAR
jgi:hypothetical protein